MQCVLSSKHSKSTPVGFEPTRGDPIGLAGRRLSRSAKVSMLQGKMDRLAVRLSVIARKENANKKTTKSAGEQPAGRL